MFAAQRNAITWIDDEMFVFDLITDADTTLPKYIGSSSSEEDDEIVWENPAVDDLSCGTETAAAVNIESQLRIVSVVSELDGQCNVENMMELAQVCHVNVMATPHSSMHSARVRFFVVPWWIVG